MKLNRKCTEQPKPLRKATNSFQNLPGSRLHFWDSKAWVWYIEYLECCPREVFIQGAVWLTPEVGHLRESITQPTRGKARETKVQNSSLRQQEKSTAEEVIRELCSRQGEKA